MENSKLPGNTPGSLHYKVILTKIRIRYIPEEVAKSKQSGIQ